MQITQFFNNLFKFFLVYLTTLWTIFNSIPSHNFVVAEHISFWTICRPQPDILAFIGFVYTLCLIEIPLPHETEQGVHWAQGPVVQSGSTYWSNSSSIGFSKSLSESEKKFKDFYWDADALIILKHTISFNQLNNIKLYPNLIFVDRRINFFQRELFHLHTL